ncbi:MAG: response regulator [Syntrophobacteraceae bacterium]
MDRKEEELLKQLLPMFRIEAQDHLKIISSGLIEIEQGDPEKQAEIIEAVYRESHSLKGAARSVNLTDIVAVCQSMENVFSCFKRKAITLSSRVLDLLHQAIDCTAGIVAGEVSPSDRSKIGELVQKLEEVTRIQKPEVADTYERIDIKFDAAYPGEISVHESITPDVESTPKTSIFIPPEVPAVLAQALAGTIRVSSAKLDELLLLAEEMLSIKLATAQRTAELKGLKNDFVRWKKEKAKTFKAAAGQEKKRELRDRDGLDSFVPAFETGLTKLVKAIENDQRSFGAMVDALLDDMKETLMLPCSSLLEIFPRFLRDLSRDTGKEAELRIDGGEIEIDRRVLEQIKDPLIHLVRNCVDHGIEMPHERERKKKPRCGNIKIAVFSRDNRIEISVSDDGAGIDTGGVKSAARRSGLISREEAERLDEREALSLVFRSGVTTSSFITDISGRGLGLAIVREKVEKLSGAVTLETQPDAGTTIRMVVPLTLATFRGVLVRVGERLFIVPSTNIERVARIRKEEIKTIENRETISFNNRAVSLVRLADVLRLKTGDSRPGTDDSVMEAVMLVAAEEHMAFLVDEVLHEQEVLVKGLGSQLSRVRNISGATVLGSGKVAPILSVPDLMISASKIAPTAAAALAGEPQKRMSVLVVEDSITARTLLKSILESAGYDVTTAFDGIDAFTALKTRQFDLVVSDVEMPRMNGFELTANIRAHRDFSELPVVLVTARESREDKERGIDVGANAYIVKSSFEQSNLLEVVRRLI